MNELINQKRYQESVSYQILGGERQTLQLVLMPGQSVITKKDATLFSSDNITSRNIVNSWLLRLYNWIALKRQEVCLEIKNDSGSIGYVGLQVMKGRVIIIDNEVTEKMVVKEKYVLAHTYNIELSPYTQHQSTEEKTVSEKFRDLSLPSQELIFLQSQSNFIEKTLGANEKIKIRPECLVAFSQTVSIQRDLGNGVVQNFSSRSKFVNVTGPGLLYIDMQVGNRFFKKDQMSLYAIVLYFMLYFLMFILMTLGRDIERN
ncbi:UNKNOWN [Stylonychia lemnae]|uniref:Uncharacterized protein n=1 Tax=Stylonychia lemnae TaxID=5949 RepID=A0A077ZRY0_STYLE|nr:UNKNOWN [Stylonychia lemnae]|eukprot:CDW72115.1 UNKNOWN [Stylonychia lemnae]